MTALTADVLNLIRVADQQIVTYTCGTFSIDGIEQDPRTAHEFRNLILAGLLVRRAYLVETTAEGRAVIR